MSIETREEQEATTEMMKKDRKTKRGMVGMRVPAMVKATTGEEKTNMEEEVIPAPMEMVEIDVDRMKELEPPVECGVLVERLEVVRKRMTMR